MATRLLRGLAGVVFSCALAVMLAEIAIRTFDVFAHARRVAAGVPDETPAPARGNPVPPRSILHPFVGFTQDAGPAGDANDAAGDRIARGFFGSDYTSFDPATWPTTINAQGFASHIADYRTVDPARFVIGVFGGSVAQFFANAVERTLKPDLARALGMEEHNLEVFTFARPGWKQPQQVIALLQALMLGIPLDVVVEIDGFNEAALGGLDCSGGYHPLFPSAQHYLTVLHLLARDVTPATLEPALDVARLRERARWLRAVATRPWLRPFETARAVLGVAIERTEAAAAVGEQELQRASAADARGGIPIPHIDDPRLGSEACAELVADLWFQSSVAMAAIASQAGLAYVQVLQPHQYVAGSKPLSDEEKAKAWTPDHPWSRSAAAGYPALQRRSGALVERGVVFRDLSGIFANHPETLYFDTCCHFNLRGNRVVLDAIAPLLTAHVKPPTSAPGPPRRPGA
jgi:hypothetical protein